MMAFFLFPEICVHRSFLYFTLPTVPSKFLQELLSRERTVSTALLRILKILLSAFRVSSAKTVRSGAYQLRKQRYPLR